MSREFEVIKFQILDNADFKQGSYCIANEWGVCVCVHTHTILICFPFQ